jgi:hypothetical protein
MGKFLVEKNEAHREILVLMDALRLQVKQLDHKVSILARKTIGLEFAAPEENDGSPQAEVVDSPPN